MSKNTVIYTKIYTLISPIIQDYVDNALLAARQNKQVVCTIKLDNLRRKILSQLVKDGHDDLIFVLNKNCWIIECKLIIILNNSKQLSYIENCKMPSDSEAWSNLFKSGLQAMHVIVSMRQSRDMISQQQILSKNNTGARYHAIENWFYNLQLQISDYFEAAIKWQELISVLQDALGGYSIPELKLQSSLRFFANDLKDETVYIYC